MSAHRVDGEDDSPNWTKEKIETWLRLTSTDIPHNGRDGDDLAYESSASSGSVYSSEADELDEKEADYEDRCFYEKIVSGVQNIHGGRCVVCQYDYVDAVHVIRTTKSGDSQMQWLHRCTIVSLSFGFYAQRNLLTLCRTHHVEYIQDSFAFLPIAEDIDSLIQHEQVDFERRIHLQERCEAFAPRTLPALSGLFQFVNIDMPVSTITLHQPPVFPCYSLAPNHPNLPPFPSPITLYIDPIASIIRTWAALQRHPPKRPMTQSLSSVVEKVDILVELYSRVLPGSSVKEDESGPWTWRRRDRVWRWGPKFCANDIANAYVQLISTLNPKIETLGEEEPHVGGDAG